MCIYFNIFQTLFSEPACQSLVRRTGKTKIMNKTELISSIAEKTNLDKNDVEKIVNTFVSVVIENLKQNKDVTLTGFGTFLAKFRSARKGVNPQNPSEKIDIPETTVPKFKAGKTLKDALKKNRD